MELESNALSGSLPRATMTLEPKRWPRRTHERRVERFYGHGAERYIDFHDGYLNFGLWEDGNTDYVTAAENMVRRLGESAGLNADSRLLDVACGMGMQDIFMLRHFGVAEIDAIDVTWKHIQHGRRRAKQFDCEDRVRFHHGTATDLEFADNTFTHVMSVEGSVHFNTRERFMREAFRVLRPGGVLVVSDYILKRKARTAFEKGILDAGRRMWQIPMENKDAAEGFSEKLSRTGFESISLKEVGAQVFPGYYYEHLRPETIRELSKIRGRIFTRLGLIVDNVSYRIFKMGLAEYVLVRAEKPAS